jgi:hypothetical protein
MITNLSVYEDFKARSLAEENLDLESKFRILEALYQEACHLGWFGERDLLLGLDVDVRLAAALNANVSNPPR